ncbi:MAG: Smr/MutS family protein, partial [Anaerolineae bacterium]|nr:Smr/MutS family protein [Anaerolineae bacterium]
TKQRDEIETLRDELAEKRDELQSRLDNIESERRDVVREARRDAEHDLETFQSELKKMRNELRRTGMSLDKIQALQQATEKISEWTKTPLDENEVEQLEDVDWNPKLGDTVFLDSLNSVGEIVEMDVKEAVIQVGNLRVRAKYNAIRKRNRAERRADEAKSRTRERQPMLTPRPVIESPGLEIDLRGQRVDEALEKLDRYIDAAYLSGLPFGRIIHGKGTGKLRQAVRDYVHAHALVSKVTAAAENEGGSGVTIIHIAPAN